jgi:hypothetical protein
VRAAGGFRRRHHQPGRRPRHAGTGQPLLDQQIAANSARKMQEPAKTLLIDNQELSKVVKENEAKAERALDIAHLEAGRHVIEGRYKYIEKIGKGAFGTVLLMEDTVVEERLILKFLNPTCPPTKR